MNLAHIAATGIALPPKVMSEHYSALDQEVRTRLGQSQQIRDMIKMFVKNSQIVSRHSISPCWQLEHQKVPGVEDIFTPFNFEPPAYLRAKFWFEHAPKLAIEAARAALDQWGGSPNDITHVVTTSTSGWAEPGIACELIEKLGLSEDTRKIEININGCFCGASCLRTARDIIRGGESKGVLVVAVELASVGYSALDTDISSLVASSLFADGAGAAIITPKGRWLLDQAGMSIVPNTKHMLRLTPNHERESTTTKMFLHQQVPAALAQYFKSGRGKRLLDELLYDYDGHPDLAIHPGGPNILEGIENVLIERGWPKDCLKHSYKTLRETGNLGSAAVLFVLHNLLNSTHHSEAAYFAFGPGVTVEWGKLRQV